MARAGSAPGAGRLLAACSGFAALGYEIVWTQQLGVALGHEYIAVLAVVAAFFTGCSAGALWCARAIERSATPARWYVACEAVIAGWALALCFGMRDASALVSRWLGAEPSALWHWMVAFGGPCALLLPATAAIGVTLPALERAAGGRTRLSGLYAANTFGAVAGVLAATWLCIPNLGLTRTAQLCAALNAGCALAAAALWWRQRSEAVPPIVANRHPFAVFSLAIAGALGVGYEVLAVRVLSQSGEGTVYSFAILLAVYLLGTALGSAGFQRWFRRRALANAREVLAFAVALACLGSGAALWLAPQLRAALAQSGAVGPLAVEAVLAVLAFLPPSAAMALLLMQLCSDSRRTGTALAANTFGAACAPFLFGVVLLPQIGVKAVLLAIVVGYAALARSRRSLLIAGGAATLLAIFAPAVVRVDTPPGGRLVHYTEGVAASVSVRQDAAGIRTLHIDNREQEGSSASLFSDARQAWLPLLLHPAPRRALFLGLGSGVTAGSAGWYPGLEVTAVELLPEVAAAAASFRPALGGAPAPRVVIADARRFVRAEGPHYDVIVADLFHPARSGAGALYTREHFAAVRSKLAAGGLFCQWLPLHQLELPTLRSIVATFLAEYPQALALVATHSVETPVLGLVAQRDAGAFDVASLRARLHELMGPGRLDMLQLEDERDMLGTFIAGQRALRRWAAGAQLNTDDRPLVIYRAPRLAYARDSTARERLRALLGAVDVAPGELLANADLQEHGARLGSYLRSCRHYLELGTRVEPSSDARLMLAQLRGPLLEILATSPDFRPAYDPLVRIAAALPPNEARPLLASLIALQPARSEAAQLMSRVADAR